MHEMQDAYELIGRDRPGPWLVTCDHATNRVPPDVGGGTLGLDSSEMGRHIAFDVGAGGVARALADHLNAAAILARFSRLVIDPNRGEDDPTLIMQVYDHTIVPGNRRLTDEDRTFRTAHYYRPYHEAVAEMAARHRETILVAIHSFTPRLNGRSYRPWHIGILYDDREADFARPLLDRLRAEPDLVVGENEPYAGHLPGDSVDRHAIIPGRPNALIELRHDLIDTEAKQAQWAARLAPILEAARADADL